MRALKASLHFGRIEEAVADGTVHHAASHAIQSQQRLQFGQPLVGHPLLTAAQPTETISTNRHLGEQLISSRLCATATESNYTWRSMISTLPPRWIRVDGDDQHGQQHGGDDSDTHLGVPHFWLSRFLLY